MSRSWVLQKSVLLLVIGGLIGTPVGLATAEEGPVKKKIQMVKRVAQGEVSAVGGGGLALVVDHTANQEQEIWFPVDSTKVKLSGLKKWGDLKAGDIAEVAYLEAPDGSRRIAKEVRFIRPKPVELPAAVEAESEESTAPGPVLRSQEQTP